MICERTVEIETNAACGDFLRAMAFHELGQDDSLTFSQIGKVRQPGILRPLAGSGQCHGMR